MKIHDVKIHPEFFSDVVNGVKPFEVRKNDRDYKVGEKLVLKEYCPVLNEYTNRICFKEITYVLKGGSFGLDSDYVVLGLKEASPTASADKNKMNLSGLTSFYTQIKSIPMLGEAERIKQELLHCMLACIENEKVDKETLENFRVKTKELLMYFLKEL
ncbi:DUF3850 domain-containing protein [Ancylomarina sp. DW003]|nr:ASCH/PUA domain-containing protein [Ancylomarina sp. DW003]MDE5421746.1 DUF3850 domain-containing protein [Ancylomarina sp. DW003]